MKWAPVTCSNTALPSFQHLRTSHVLPPVRFQRALLLHHYRHHPLNRLPLSLRSHRKRRLHGFFVKIGVDSLECVTFRPPWNVLLAQRPPGASFSPAPALFSNVRDRPSYLPSTTDYFYSGWTAETFCLTSDVFPSSDSRCPIAPCRHHSE